MAMAAPNRYPEREYLVHVAGVCPVLMWAKSADHVRRRVLDAFGPRQVLKVELPAPRKCTKRHEPVV